MHIKDIRPQADRAVVGRLSDGTRSLLRNGRADAGARRSRAWESNVIAAYHQLAHTEQRIIETGKRDETEWEARNAAFHDAISEACPLHWLKLLRSQIFTKAQRYRFLAWSILPDPATIAAEHREIFEAAMARDEERLIAAMSAHIGNVELYARELVVKS